MRGNEFLDKMEFVDAAYVEEADKQPTNKRHRWIKWGAVAACFCLVAVSAFSFLQSNITHQPAPILEKIHLPQLAVAGMGFEGYMYYTASEITNDNPWNETMEITEMPVYLNKAYDASGAGVPRGLNEEEMRSLLDSTVSALGIEGISTEVITGGGEDGDPVLTALHATTEKGEKGEIYVLADGSIRYFLPDGGLALPDGYSYATDRAARETIIYLSALYRDLLHMENPVAAIWGDYNIYGEYYRRYTAYDAGGNDLEDILNYTLCSVSFFPNDDGKLRSISIHNALAVAEKIGDYPVVSASEAEQRLLAGNYQTSVPYAMPGEEYVAKVELIYRTGRLEEMLIPYYRFYVLLPDMERDNGLQIYGAYYVPAITDEYIANMPVYDGHFN